MFPIMQLYEHIEYILEFEIIYLFHDYTNTYDKNNWEIRVNLISKARFAAYLGKYNSNDKQPLRLNVNNVIKLCRTFLPNGLKIEYSYTNKIIKSITFS